MLIPFKLIPSYKEYVWGGKKLRPQADITAEAWIVSEEDIVADGPYFGKTLAKVVELEGIALLGSKVVSLTGRRFPLLIKLLDCEDWLSLQVHPNNEQAKKLAGPTQFGKTEAWYVIDADNEAQLISGLKPNVTRQDIQAAAGKKEILDLVERRSVKAGDTINIAPGTIHALGPGLLIYEVQQNSDLTYRVYDWDRPMDGTRKLHIAESIEVLDPNEKGIVKSFNEKALSSPINTLASCRYFTLTLMRGNQSSVKVNTMGESFAVITSIDSTIIVKGSDWSFTLNPLETLFIPAEVPPFEVAFTDDGRALLARC
ncbi:MAG: class I mannose-6-phosphate isomerase [Anaerolineae bacterium]|nr:class I mannose-6-phosphate isomerase [Anaerolineae bacterium]